MIWQHRPSGSSITTKEINIHRFERERKKEKESGDMKRKLVKLLLHGDIEQNQLNYADSVNENFLVIVQLKMEQPISVFIEMAMVNVYE